MDIVNKDKWAPLIGRFVLAFGDIESFIYSMQTRMVDETVLKHTQRLSLDQRIKFVHDLLLNCDMDEVIAQKFIDAITKVENLRKQRNLIAHNPLFLVFYEDSDIFEPEEAICNFKRNDEILNYESLSKIVNEAESIANELYIIDSERRGLNNLSIDSLQSLDFGGLSSIISTD